MKINFGSGHKFLLNMISWSQLYYSSRMLSVRLSKKQCQLIKKPTTVTLQCALCVRFFLFLFFCNCHVITLPESAILTQSVSFSSLSFYFGIVRVFYGAWTARFECMYVYIIYQFDYSIDVVAASNVCQYSLMLFCHVRTVIHFNFCHFSFFPWQFVFNAISCFAF